MSSKTASYYDWSLGFKKSVRNETFQSDTNSLGINESDFKAYMKKWKQNNL
jgi:hypothetical protein